jgi:cell division protein ZipA
MGMRDWLIVIVIVGIILILLDGYRRKRKDSIRVKLEKNIPDHDVELDTAAELPNGGARVVSRDELLDNDNDYQEYDEEDEDYIEDSEVATTGKTGISVMPEEDDETVPVLMDAVDLEGVARVNKQESPMRPSQNFEDEDADEETDQEELEDEIYSEDYLEEDVEETSSTYTDEQVYAELDEDDVSAVRTIQREAPEKTESQRSSSKQERIEPTFGEISSFSDEELEDRPSHLKPATKQKNVTTESGAQAELFAESPEDFIQEDEQDETEAGYLEPEEVIVINVMAKQGEVFAGSDLLPILLQQDMRLGKMSIFHKHADSNGNGPAIFSMANMVKPGTFDVTQMEEFTTPGVSFFLQLPNAFGNMKSFEQMLKAADAIKQKLNGDLKDEHRSVITRQTIEHCRQRIQDFELAQLSKK